MTRIDSSLSLPVAVVACGALRARVPVVSVKLADVVLDLSYCDLHSLQLLQSEHKVQQLMLPLPSGIAVHKRKSVAWLVVWWTEEAEEKEIGDYPAFAAYVYNPCGSILSLKTVVEMRVRTCRPIQ